MRIGVVVWLILACGVVAALHVGKAAIATPMLLADLGLGLGEAGWLTGIFAVLGLLGGAPAGVVAAAIGGRRTLLLGLGVMALAGTAGAAAPSYPILLASRLLEGLGCVLIIVAGPAILERLTTGARRDMAFSLWRRFMPCGMAIAMLAGPLVQTWQACGGGGAGLGPVSAVLVLCCAPQGASVGGGALGRMSGEMRCLRSSRGTPLLATGFAVYRLIFFALCSFVPVVLMERMDVSYRQA